MGRPPRHDADRLLDVAAGLAATEGPGGVTMAAVARGAGAPSGSVYHRFPTHPALLAALWLRSVERFQAGFLDALTAPDPGDAARAAARHVVAWSRANPTDTTILLYGAHDFGADAWPDEERDRLARANRGVARAVRALAGRLGDTTAQGVDLVRLATVDLPYSLVRRHRGRRLPRHAEDLVVHGVSALLGL
jgi:AcrR family transcriptional regulator